MPTPCGAALSSTSGRWSDNSRHMRLALREAAGDLAERQGLPGARRALMGWSPLGLLQDPAQHDLAIRVQVTSWDEAQAGGEAERVALALDVAG